LPRPRDITCLPNILQAIGKGAYGVVCSAKNTLTGEKVAIKKIGNAFENLTDARRTLREIKLLRHLRHENVIGVRDIMKASRDRFNDVYLVYELMDTDLHQIIRSSQPLTNEHFQYFIYQVMAVGSCPAHAQTWGGGPASSREAPQHPTNCSARVLLPVWYIVYSIAQVTQHAWHASACFL
jgi:hypothetical protein